MGRKVAKTALRPGVHALATVVMMMVTVVVMSERLSRYGRDGKDCDSGEGKHEVAKLHWINSSLHMILYDFRGPAL